MTAINLGSVVSSVEVEYDGRTIGTISSGENLGAKLKSLVNAAAPGIKNVEIDIDNDGYDTLSKPDLAMTLEEVINKYGDFSTISVTGSVAASGA